MTADDEFFQRVDLTQVRQLLEDIMPDVDWDDSTMAETPRRFVTMLHELTSPEDFKFTTFPNENRVGDMVIIQDIPFVSLCAHHIVPFVGQAHVAYIPEDTIAGLSKFARAVKSMARGLWVQEELTHAVLNFLVDELNPLGLGVVMKAEHMCMTIRGVQSPGTKTTTSAMHGVFLNPEKGARQEFLELIK